MTALLINNLVKNFISPKSDILTFLHSDSEPETALFKVIETALSKMKLLKKITLWIIIKNFSIILPEADLYRSVLFEFCLLISMTKPVVPEKSGNIRCKHDSSLSS